jgi:predicted  nucleic acid-binding Zn-ribbon protein
MSTSAGGSGRVEVHVCVACGNERMVEEGESLTDAPCEKCGNQVFRAFYDTASPGEAEEDFTDSTGRETATDEPAPETDAGDLSDLNNP